MSDGIKRTGLALSQDFPGAPSASEKLLQISHKTDGKADELNSQVQGHPTGNKNTKTACIRTFGCQMNVHDSDRMRRMVLDAGYAEVKRYEDADIVVLNTCYVRENAVDRVRGHLGELTRLKREGLVKKVALTGCIGASREGKDLQKQYNIDLVLGTHNTYELAEFVGLPNMRETYTPELPGTEGEHAAFVTIMTGCNYQCSYCIVPTVRGRMVCRSMESILGEVRRLVEGGTKYITLLGQTVDAWREDGKRFCDLLERVADIAPRVWFTTSHPSNMEDRTHPGHRGERDHSKEAPPACTVRIRQDVEGYAQGLTSRIGTGER